MSCDNPFGGSILAARQGQDHLTVVPDEPGPVLAPASGPVLDDTPGPGPVDAGTSTAMVLAGPLRGSQMNAAELLLAFLKRQGKQVWATARKKSALAGMARHLWTAQPESAAHHRAHVKAAAWVPEGYGDVTWLKWARRIWIAEHLTVGRFCVVLGNSISAMGARTRRRAGAAAFMLLAVILVWVFA